VEGLPAGIQKQLDMCDRQHRQGRTAEALAAAQQAAQTAQQFLEVTPAHDEAEQMRGHLSVCLASIWLADIHREQQRWGPALRASSDARKALDTIPKYTHRHHLRALAAYQRGLLYQSIGSDAQALALYDEADAQFQKALTHWEGRFHTNPLMAKVCHRIVDWVQHLNEPLPAAEGRQSEVGGESDAQQEGDSLYVAVSNGSADNRLARLRLVTALEPTQRVIIAGQAYRFYHPGTGLPYRATDHLPIESKTIYSLIRINEDGAVGPLSVEGDYALVGWHPGWLKERIAGISWEHEERSWRTFSKEPVTIGGREGERQPIQSLVLALLKPETQGDPAQ
jgi:tetratricopeptide (TPR) repeat protein